MALSCGSYLLGIVCMTILGYFYDKIPYRNLLYIIPICLLLFGAIFSCTLHIMYPIFLIEWKEVSKKDIKEMTTKKVAFTSFSFNISRIRFVLRLGPSSKVR